MPAPVKPVITSGASSGLQVMNDTSLAGTQTPFVVTLEPKRMTGDLSERMH